jgi:hypothetical protein
MANLYQYLFTPSNPFGQFNALEIFVFVLMMAWSLFWKGWALWRAANQKQKIWFICFLIINTVGLLEILYLFVFSKERKAGKTAHE